MEKFQETLVKLARKGCTIHFWPDGCHTNVMDYTGFPVIHVLDDVRGFIDRPIVEKAS